MTAVRHDFQLKNGEIRVTLMLEMQITCLSVQQSVTHCSFSSKYCLKKPTVIDEGGKKKSGLYFERTTVAHREASNRV